MTAPFENIVQHLFHQPSLQSVTVDEIRRVTAENPSFAAAHFLLLKKLQEIADPGFKDQLQKTTLYFNNPLWLQFLLQPHQQLTVTAPAASEKEPETVQQEVTEAPVYQNVVELAELSNAEQVEESVYSSNGNGSMHESTAEISYTHSAAEPAEVDTVTHAEQPVIEEPPVEENKEEPAGDILPETETVAAIAVDNDQDNYAKSEEEANATDEPVTATIGEHPSLYAEKTMAETTIIVETTSSAKADILFEPFHTVDYFASQGIKLDKSGPNAQDKLGKQLRSFTEWLKSMKKLPQASINQVLADNDESQVVAAARSSVEEKEVITEAMAEVFEKQGMKERAMDVYQKLSLLNPAKTAYFAAKIEDLKK
jgi:hypothetical protein